jgi:hypothetical protein
MEWKYGGKNVLKKLQATFQRIRTKTSVSRWGSEHPPVTMEHIKNSSNVIALGVLLHVSFDRTLLACSLENSIQHLSKYAEEFCVSAAASTAACHFVQERRRNVTPELDCAIAILMDWSWWSHRPASSPDITIRDFFQ